ncbi:MAG TPA: hypothetical protein VHO72_06510 [Bacteroidales bacterium]|nr:hypothetical protein [Bacteroidales bacterium]
MTYYIIIILCFIVLIAYLFEITTKFTKIPGVILLMALGLTLRHLATFYGFRMPDFSILLPIMGTLGLILIVLEGSLDLTISTHKKQLLKTSFASAFFLFLIFVTVVATILYYFLGVPLKTTLINAIPIGIISSAVAIPSALNLETSDREFVIYESSVSDIIGILLFDFVLYNQYSIGGGLMFFLLQIVVSIIISVIISAGLAYMLHKINHHVKYIIILTAVILVFIVAKMIHWPSLIVVLIFGLILNNNHLFRNLIITRSINFNEFNTNLSSFKQITGELTFLVRSFFFLIFGFYTPVEELLNLQSLAISASIYLLILLLRGLFFRFIIKKSLVPLLYFAPRGLITILLFLSIPAHYKLPFINEGVVTQTIFISIIMMTVGTMLSSTSKEPAFKENSTNS